MLREVQEEDWVGSRSGVLPLGGDRGGMEVNRIKTGLKLRHGR